MKLTLTALFIVLAVISGLAQSVPTSTSYQAVARDSEGEILANANLNIRISILSSSTDGDVQWEEIHSTTTNDFGLFTLEIGLGSSTGTGLSISYVDIDWAADDHFLMVEIDPGDGIYELMGVSQLLAVPYAYHARTVEIDQTEDADADPNNETIDSATLDGNIITIVENGVSYEIDLTDLASDEDWNVVDNIIYNNSDAVGINTTNPSSSLEINGSFSAAVNFISISDDLTINLDEDDHTVVIELNTADMEVVLPLAETCQGRVYIIKAISAIATDTVIIGNDTDLIDGESELVLNGVLRQSAHLISAGSNGWIIID